MSVLMNKDSRVVIQGFGGAGQREAATGIAYGTQIVGGVTPGKGGTDVEGIPVFNSVKEAVAAYVKQVEASVPRPAAAPAAPAATSSTAPSRWPMSIPRPGSRRIRS